jgi:CO/xanthine dehydrogenase Mo-binding subunit
LIPPLAALSNAIYDALGVRMTSLPMSPGAILEEVWKKRGEENK